MGQRRYRFLFGCAAVVPLFLAVASFALLWRTSSELEQTMASVNELEATVQRTDLIVRLVLDVESGQRGFVVTGNEEFLQAYERAALQLPGLLEQMNAFSLASGHARSLQQAVAEAVLNKLEHARANIAVARNAGLEEAARRVGQKRGKELMDQVRQRTAELNAAEVEQLALRREKLSASLRHQRWLATGLVVTLGVLCGLVGWLIWEVGRARALARMCAWSRTVEYEGDWLSFEEYLMRRFGVDTTHGICPVEAAKARAQLQTVRTSDRLNGAPQVS